MSQFAREGSQEQFLRESWFSGQPSFDVRPGQINEYTISLPEEVLNVVREKLKADVQPKVK